MSQGNNKISKAFHRISTEMAAHYDRTFSEHGTSSQGVDWSAHPDDHLLRLEKMLNIAIGPLQHSSILDVGCGYGALLDLMKSKGISAKYTGIDVCGPMIAAARERNGDASWICADILEYEGGRFDYVVCNGVFTQKLTTSNREMDSYLRHVVQRMFDLCRIGVCFNVMSTHVNFTAPNLYYRNPAELLAWAMTTLSAKVKMDHAYPMFEYTLYIYKEEAPGIAHHSHRTVSRDA